MRVDGRKTQHFHMTLTALEKSGKVQICNLTLRPFGFFYVPIEASLKSIKVTGAVSI